jgi:hypothetical protein
VPIAVTISVLFPKSVSRKGFGVSKAYRAKDGLLKCVIAMMYFLLIKDVYSGTPRRVVFLSEKR